MKNDTIEGLANRETVIKLCNVSKTFTLTDRQPTVQGRVFSILQPGKKREIKALKDISLEIKKGEFFGILGHNGSGKSTLLRIMAGIYQPDKGGKVYRKGKFMRLALGMGFDGELTAHENIFVNASILGLSLRKIREKHDQIIEMAELNNYTHTKVKYFSSGMLSRLKFAIAVHAEAEIFFMDEFFGGVGDLKFRKTSEEIFKEAFIKGRTIVHISHNLSTLKDHCDRLLLLHKGEMLALGPPEEIIDKYKKVMLTQ
jgi:ABC-type polysaccharide/polyol phosphate transport system ATPase subunit